LRLVFFGTPPFARTVLEYLLQQGAEVAAVITKPDKPVGRHSAPMSSAVKQCALEHNLPVLQPLKASDPTFVETVLRPLQADLYVVVAYSEILKENLLREPRYGCVNVHASLLPKYRGAAPIQRCILEGESQSGVTIMAMDVGLDTGGMFKQVIIPITEDMTAGELSHELAAQGAPALWGVLQEISAGTIQAIPQPPTSTPYAKKLQTADGRLDWTQSSEEVYRRIRAMTPKPGAWCEIEIRGEKKRLSIRQARHCPDVQGTPGQVIRSKNFPFIITCRTGAIALLEIQVEGKKSLTAQAFLNGISFDQLKFLNH